MGDRDIDRAEDRGDREQGADETEPERERAALDELRDDLRLLARGSGERPADDPPELELGLLGAVDESEDADDEREERDEGEEDLVGDRAGEERAVVVEERADDPAYG